MLQALLEVLTFHYRLYDDYENLLESSYEQAPVTFVSGGEQVIPQVEEVLLKLGLGEKKILKISSEALFISSKKGGIKEVSRDQFPRFRRFEVGDQLSLKEDDGQVFIYTVTAVAEDRIRMVASGASSREQMTFHLELLGRRPLTEGEVIDGQLRKLYVFKSY